MRIGTEQNAFLRVWKASSHFEDYSNLVSFFVNAVIGVHILEKSIMNRW